MDISQSTNRPQTILKVLHKVTKSSVTLCRTSDLEKSPEVPLGDKCNLRL